MKMYRMGSVLRCTAISIIAGFCAMGGAHAETFPNKPVRVVVIVAPGGSADAMARMVGEGLTQRLGQSVIVENKPGAGGNLASQLVSRSAADGYTLLLSANNHTINPALFSNAGYKVDDFVPVAALMQGPSVIAVPTNSKYQSLADVLADAKQHPDGVSYGIAGIGTPSHIAGELLERAAGIELSHIAYRGSGPSITDAVGGQVPIVIASLVATMPQIQAKKLRALAVTSNKRWPSLPDVPAASEFGMPDYEHMTWLGLFAPKGTPQPVVTKLNKAVQAVLEQANLQTRVTTLGGKVVLEDAAQFNSFIQKDYVASSKLVRESKLKAE